MKTKKLTQSKKLLLSALTTSIVLNIFAIIFISILYLSQKQSIQGTTNSESTVAQQNEEIDTNINPDIKELSNLENLTIGKKNTEVNIIFSNSENTTYDEKLYSVRGEKIILLNLKLNRTNFTGQIQKLPSNTSYFIDFVYEGWFAKPTDTLEKELEQKPGYYPRTIYNNPYEIFTNKNGLKMKRQYYQVPGYLTYEIEFLIPTPYDIHYRYRYYNFETYISVDRDLFNHSAFYKDPVPYIKTNPQKEFTSLDNFINSINYQ